MMNIDEARQDGPACFGPAIASRHQWRQIAWLIGLGRDSHLRRSTMARLSFLRVAVAASLGLAFGAFSTIAGAGTQSNQDWFQDQPPQPPSSGPATAIGGAGGRDFGGPNGPAVQQPPPRVIPQQANMGSGCDFPGDQMQDWVNAYARMARTRALLRRAESNLDRSVRDAQLNFEQSREYRDAVAAEKKAYDEYTAERARALKSVLDDPKYVAALQLRDK